jgi:hypothetical protein
MAHGKRMSMLRATNLVHDVSDYEESIRREGLRRYDNNQRTGIEGMTNKNKARMQHTLGAAAEVAARLHYRIDPYGIEDDEIGKADLEVDGVKFDVKCVKTEYPKLNVQHYDGVLDRKHGWLIQVMYYEGFGWRFMLGPIISYQDLAYMPLVEPVGGHRSKHWSIDLGTK